MAAEPETMTHELSEAVEMPRPTVAPLVLALGMTLLAAGVATSPAFLVVGALVLIFGLGLWVSQLLPGRGEHHEPRVAPELRPRPIEARPGGVARLKEGMPGSRLRLPTEVHPISAGVKGGILGGLLMPIPALAWGISSGHGIWYPTNLLTGLVLPGVERMTTAELEQFRLPLLLLGLTIHAINSVTFGMIYGVLMPTLPRLPLAIAWGGLAMPLLWTTLSYNLMGLVNPTLSKGVDWPWFIASQFLFGIAAASVLGSARGFPPLRAGLVAGAVGGAIMPIPALLWSLSTGRGVWYPANLLVGMVLPGMDRLGPEELTSFHPGWLAIAVAMHALISLGFGVVFGLLIPRFPPIPTTLAWGGLLMPLAWSSVSFSLMGVVNPLLQRRVDWPWFIASQFVFGIATAIVVERSERVFIPPAGRGQESLGEFAVGTAGGEA